MVASNQPSRTGWRGLVVRGPVCLLLYGIGWWLTAFAEPIATWAFKQHTDAMGYVDIDQFGVWRLGIVGLGALIQLGAFALWILWVNKVSKR